MKRELLPTAAGADGTASRSSGGRTRQRLVPTYGTGTDATERVPPAAQSGRVSGRDQVGVPGLQTETDGAIASKSMSMRKRKRKSRSKRKRKRGGGLRTRHASRQRTLQRPASKSMSKRKRRTSVGLGG
jgi:hypothetical protein